MTDSQHIRIGWLGEAGPAAWYDPARPASLDWSSPDPYIEMTRVLDNAGVDFVLFDDAPGIPGKYMGSFDSAIEQGVGLPRLDPSVLVPMLAVHTQSIGFVATLSTSYYAPYLLARLLATLDHVTAGRVGWNIATSITRDAAETFGLPAFGLPDVPPEAIDPDLIEEYLEVVTALFSGWEPDAVVLDAATGVFADPTKVHPLDFSGRYFRVRGPLNIVPSPQGSPLIVASDLSAPGLSLAGRYADVVVAPLSTVDEMRMTRDRVRGAAETAGRDPDSVKTMFIVEPLLARTQGAVPPLTGAISEGVQEQRGLVWLSAMTAADMAGEDLDRPLRRELLASGGLRLLHAAAGASSMPLRELARRIGAGDCHDLRGTAEQIADRLEELFDAVGGDGFLISGRWTPTYVTAVGDQLIGELRRRGRVAPPSPGSTLRERIGASKAGAVAR